MNDEQFFLANAYLDGELTDEEREIAEHDPAVMAEVDELRALQRELRSVDPPSTDAREAGIAAAMAAFGAPDAPPAPTMTSRPEVAPVVPITRRPWFSRALTAAAAVVGLGVLAVVVTRVPGGDDDAGDDAALELTAEDFESRETAEDTADAADGQELAEAEVPTAAPDAGGDAATSEDMAEDEMAADDVADIGEDTGAAEGAVEESSGGVASGGAGSSVPAVPCPAPEVGRDPLADPGSTPDDPITDVDQLCDLARSLLDDRDSGELAATPETSCPTRVIWGSAYFDWVAGPTEVFIAIDADDRFVTVVETRSCAHLLTVDLRPDEG
jgi:hypothetical protein